MEKPKPYIVYAGPRELSRHSSLPVAQAAADTAGGFHNPMAYRIVHARTGAEWRPRRGRGRLRYALIWECSVLPSLALHA